MSGSYLDIFTGVLRLHQYDSLQVEEHIDTLMLKREGGHFSGTLKKEICYGWDPVSNSKTDIEGHYDEKSKKLVLIYRINEGETGELHLKYSDDVIVGNYAGDNNRWDEWEKV